MQIGLNLRGVHMKIEKTQQMCCDMHHSWKKPMFIGILLFVLGLVVWAAKVGLYTEELMWANLLMVAGVIFTIKGILMVGMH
jgi:hypothetical protein